MNAQAAQAEKWNARHKVVYTSRTHSQLAQAMKELKVTEYRFLKSVALGSRDQLCINEDVLKTATNGAEKVHLCRAKVKAKLCSYHGRVEKALENPLVQNQTVMDIEDLVKVGKSCGACPYYMSKQLSGEADIVFLPYNYVLDPKLLKSFALTLEHSIVILDEGHNVEKVCQDAASAQIASSDIATCCEDITHIMTLLDENSEFRVVPTGDENAPDFTVEDCAKLKEMVLELEKAIDAIPLVTSVGRAFPAGMVFDILNAANMTQETYTLIMKLIDTFLDFLTQASEGKVFARKGAGLFKIHEFLGTVYGSMTNDVAQWKISVQRGYRLFVELEEPKKKFAAKSDGWLSSSSIQPKLSGKAKVLNFWCFNPGFGMSNLTGQGVHSIILTSGTLAPLKPLISELALDVNLRLENPHVIKKSQVLAKIISSGPDGTPLNCNFKNRDDPKYLKSLALTIKTVAARVPNGLLVFFPSYVLMNKSQDFWRQAGLWDAINEIKPIFTEPRKKEEFDECMNDYYTAVKTSRGAIFMAVLRGKVSEGLDFKDQNGRAVIVIGLPFPPWLDPQVVLKKEYLKENRNQANQLQSGDDWYNMEATRAVNQAIGRVIRHKDDYGAILLCDQRFSNYTYGLSRWVQNHIEKPTGKFLFGPIIGELTRFFQNASSTLPEPVEFKVEPLGDVVDLVSSDEMFSTAKVKSESILKKQIKIENSNEIYGNSSYQRPAVDYNAMQSFVKKEEKPTSFFGGLNREVSSIDFNSTDFTQQSSSRSVFTSQSSNEYESANKKRKLKMSANNSQSFRDVQFVMIKTPIRVSRESFDKPTPENRGEFLTSVSYLAVGSIQKSAQK